MSGIQRRHDAINQKHGVSFADAVLALEDELALTVEDEHDEESRFVTLGVDPQEPILVVVFTPRGDRIRLISARRATRRERSQYLRQPRRL